MGGTGMGVTEGDLGRSGGSRRDRRNPGSGPVALERRDEILDQRAGDAREEVEAVSVEQRGELAPRQDRGAHR